MDADAAPQSSRASTRGATPAAASPVQPVRVDRVVRGGASGPVPWVMVGLGRVWAWDQTVGLVRVPVIGRDGYQSFGWDCLTPDGRYLYYLSHDPGLDDRGDTHHRGDDRVVYDLVTGEWQSSPAWNGDNSFIGSYPRVSEGQRLAVYRTNLQGDPPNYLNGRYVVHRGGDVIELPLDDRFTFSRDGIPAQFSPTGEKVAITHPTPDGLVNSSVVDIETGQVTKYEGLGVSTCGAWSPSSSRLLLRGIRDQLPSVVDQETGSISSLKDLVFVDPEWRYSGPLVSGWLDETRVLISGTFGRRIMMATFDVDTGERVDLLDLPRPSGGEWSCIRYAPALAQANPGMVGPARGVTA